MEACRLDTHDNTGKERLKACLPKRYSNIQHFSGMMITIPNPVFLIHEWKLLPGPQQYSRLVFKLSLTGTQMYEFESPCPADDHTTGHQCAFWIKRSDDETDIIYCDVQTECLHEYI